MFRLAQIDDIISINDIYNQAVAQQFQTADINPWSLEDRIAWFHNHPSGSYPIMVIEKAGQVVGWGSLSKYRNGRKALQSTAEVSYYLDKEYQGQGIGSHLLSTMIKEAKSRGYRYLISILLGANHRSIALLMKFGFEEWGRFPEIAKIGNQSVDHLYFGKKL